mgnify:FL=1
MATIKVIQGDITTATTETIVNAANEDLRKGGGVCGAIYNKCGKRLEECITTLKRNSFVFLEGIRILNSNNNSFSVGCATVTPSFNPKVSWNIIHAVGPIYDEWLPKVAKAHLETTYVSILECVKILHYKSVAIPLISTGIYGYPLKEGIEVAIEQMKKGPEDLTVEIWCFSENDYNLTLECLKKAVS